jgi:hypothetical protein
LFERKNRMSMQAFYTKLHRADNPEARGLLQIARASLRKVFAVRSEMAWESWGESSVTA